MESIPTKPKHWIQRLSRHCHSYGISSSPQAKPGSSSARPAPAPPAPTAVWGHRDTRTHSHTKPALHSLPETPTLSPQLPGLITAASLQASCGPAGASVLAKRSPGSVFRPRPSLGAAEPERAAGRGGRRPVPQQQRCGALPENERGRSRESPRSGRAAVGAGA